MTAFIRYRTPFPLDDSSLSITVSLEKNVSLRVILGLPMMLLLRASLDFKTGTSNFYAINVEFPLHIQ